MRHGLALDRLFPEVEPAPGARIRLAPTPMEGPVVQPAECRSPGPLRHMTRPGLPGTHRPPGGSSRSRVSDRGSCGCTESVLLQDDEDRNRTHLPILRPGRESPEADGAWLRRDRKSVV